MGIGRRPLLGFGAVTALGVLAALVGWTAADRLGVEFELVRTNEIPRLSLAYGIKEAAARVTALSPRMAAARDKDTIDEVKRLIAAVHEELAGRIREAGDPRFAVPTRIPESVSGSVDASRANSADLEKAVRDRVAIEATIRDMASRVADAQRVLQIAIGAEVDAARAKLETSRERADIAALTAKLDAAATGEATAGVPTEVPSAPTSAGLMKIATRFRTLADKLNAAREGVSPETVQAIDALLSVNKGDGGAVYLRSRHVRSLSRSERLLTADVGAADALDHDALELVSTASERVGEAAAMLAVAGGKLEHPIDARGADEIAEMARALVVFRDNAGAAAAADTRAAEERRETAERRRAEMIELADELEADVQMVVESPLSSAHDMNTLAGEMSTTAETNKDEADSAARVADRTRENVQTVAAAARRPSTSIAEITSQVSRSARFATEAAEGAIREIVGRIGTISDISSSIAVAVEEREAATREIARNVEQAADGTDKLNAAVLGVADAARHTGGTAGEMRDASADVAERVRALHEDIRRVSTDIRAA